MRRILVDVARKKRFQKRGGGAIRVTLGDALAVADVPGTDLASIDDALHALARLDERKARVVELRYFGGLSVEETASVLEMSVQTVNRDWKFAKAWLSKELRDQGGRGTADGKGAAP
jgi:RNA polymerase sigma factor (TIGR02999 family)